MSGQNLLDGGGNSRAESVPPANVGGLLTATRNGGGASNLLHQGAQGLTNSQVSYLRAQSEQPSSANGAYFGTSTANFGNAPQTPMSPVRIYPMYNNQSMHLRGANGAQPMQQSNLIHLNNNLAGSNNANNLNNANLNNANNRIARVTGNVQMPHMSSGGAGGGGGDHHLFGNNILNHLNPLNNNLSANGAAGNMEHLPPLHHHFGGHHPHHHQQQQHNYNLLNPGQQATLNNQVAPGTRANNYWDNFRR